ncbi:MAG: hypothetical protein AB8F26_08265 [Phycisphaerales bacterium]
MTIGGNQVSAWYLLVLAPVLASVAWLAYLPTPIPFNLLRLGLTGILCPIAAAMLFFGWQLIRQCRARNAFLKHDGWEITSQLQYDIAKRALTDGVVWSTPSHLKAWIRSGESGPERFMQFWVGSQEQKRAYFAVEVAAATAPILGLRIDREPRVTRSLKAKVAADEFYSILGESWVVFGDPRIVTLLFTDEIRSMLDEFPAKEQRWVWRYDQLWFMISGFANEDGIRRSIEHARNVATVIGIGPNAPPVWLDEDDGSELLNQNRPAEPGG